MRRKPVIRHWWSELPVRLCATLHSCILCPEPITAGQRYYDGSYPLRAHDRCGDKADREAKQAGKDRSYPPPMAYEDPPIQCGTFRDLAELPRMALPANLIIIGKEIRRAREDQDVSMGELARFLGCHVSKLSDLERGVERDPGFVWCDACGGNEKRHDCKRCGGLGYEKRSGA